MLDQLPTPAFCWSSGCSDDTRDINVEKELSAVFQFSHDTTIGFEWIPGNDGAARYGKYRPNRFGNAWGSTLDQLRPL